MSPSSTIVDFAQFAGRFLWPRSTADLTDRTVCPACRTPLPGAICPACALDLRHPAATELLAASTDAAAALGRRVQLIGRIRYETAETQAATAAAAAAAAAEQVSIQLIAEQAQRAAEQTTAARDAAQAQEAARREVAAAAVVAAPVASAAPPSADVPATPAGPAPHKRSSVQIVLLLVGVTLVSIAAIFFLTVAWLFAGLAFRSVVVALFTLAALAVAARLRRKKLVSTAEGIGALAVVLVLLDAWAVRQNNLAGLGAGDGLLYWGIALTLCTVLFLGWHALSSLRVASVASFAAAAPALGLLAAGLAADQDSAVRVFLAALGAAVGALVHRFTLPGSGPHWPDLDRKPERITLLVLAGLAFVIGLGAGGSVRPDVTWVPLLTLGLVAVVALAHTVSVLTQPAATAGYRLFAYGTTGTAVLAVLLGAILAAVRTGTTGILFTVPLLGPVLLGLALELLWRRTPPAPAPAPRRTALLVGTLTAAMVAGSTVLAVLAAAAVPLLISLAAGLVRPGDRILEVGSESLWALGSLTLAGALTTAFWLAGGMHGWRRQTLVAVGLVIVLLATPFTAWLWLILPLFVGLGGVGLLLLLLRPRRRLGGNGPALIGFVVLAQASAWCVSWASSTSWWLGALSAVAALIAGRLLLDRASQATGRAALLSGAIVLTLVAAGTAPWALTLGARPDVALLLLHISVGLALGTALLQLACALPRIGAVSITGTERRWAFFTLLPTTLLAVLVPTGALAALLGLDRAGPAPIDSVLGLAAALLLTAGLLCWPLLPGNRPGLRWPRALGAVLIAPALFAVIDDLGRLTAAPENLLALAAPTAALLALALALAVRVTRRPDRTLLGIEAGALAVFSTVILQPELYELAWLVLLVAAVGALLSSIAADGLFASTSARRHLGWVALVLGTVSLWWGLGPDTGIPVEAYTLPVAGVLLLLAVLLWRFGRVDRAVTASAGAALLTLAGLLVALLPLAITGQTGSLARPVIVAAVSAILLLGAVLLRWAPVRSAYLAAAGLAGALGLLVTATARSLPLLTEGVAGAELEAWLVPTLVVGVVAAFLLARQTDATAARTRERAAVLLLLAVVAVPTTLEITGFSGSALGTGRALLLTAVLAVGHVLALRWPRAPLGPVAGWALAALAAAAGIGALGMARVEPFEWITVPLGLALVAGQLLDRTSTAATARALPAEDALAEAALSGARLAVQFKQGLIASGLTLALLPSALAGSAGPGDDTGLLRAVLTLVAGGLFAVGGALLVRRLRATPDTGSTPAGGGGRLASLVAWPAMAVGTVTVVIAAATHILPLFESRTVGGELEAWLLPAAAVLAATGALLADRTPDRTPRKTTAQPASGPAAPTGLHNQVSFALLVAAVVWVAGAEAAALDSSSPATIPLAAARVVLGVWFFAALHVATRWWAPGSLGRAFAWVALGAAGLIALSGWAQGLPDPLEWATVPLGLALVAGRLLPRPDTGSGRTGTGPGLVTAGLALALLPSALGGAGSGGAGSDPLRAVLTLVVGGVLALAGAVLVRRRLPDSPAAASPAPSAGWAATAAPLVSWPACLVGLTAVLVTVAGRVLPLFDSRVLDGTLEAWLLPAALLTVATGALLAWPRSAATAASTSAPPLGSGTATVARHRRVGYGLMIGTVLVVVLTELPALDYAPLAFIRVVLVVWLYALLHLAVFWADPSPLGRLLAWVAIGAAAGMVLAGFGHGAPNPIEIVSIPLAIGLIMSGLLQLEHSPRSGSRPWLAPGLLVLLLPSLLLDLSYSPLWRVVGLGVLAIAVLVIGAVRRLQAPFLIGAAVLLVHGLAQLWPWISLAYGVVPWWLWLGIGGVLLIVLAARYEQRIQNLKAVALKISALR